MTSMQERVKIALGRVGHVVSNVVFTDVNLRRIKASRAYLELVGGNAEGLRRLQREYVMLLGDVGSRNQTIAKNMVKK
jgi:hypothetical protein